MDSASTELQTRDIDPTFHASTDANQCDARCIPRVLYVAAGQLAIDAGELSDVDNAGPSSVLSVLRARLAAGGENVKPIPVPDLVQMLEKGAAPLVVLGHKSGHLWLLVGRLDVGSDVLCHLVHGDRVGTLVPVNDLAVGGFNEAWRFSMDGHPAQFRIGTGRLTVDKVLKDFGEVRQGDRVDCSFTLSNSGDTDLILMTPTTSCSCTTTDAGDKAVMHPRAKKSLGVAMYSNNHPAQRQLVKFDVVEKGSGASRTVELLLFAQQRNSMIIAPTTVDFGQVENGRSYARTISVTEAATDRCALESLEVNGLPLKGRIAAPTTDGNGLSCYRVLLELTPNQADPGKHQGEVVLLTTSSTQPRITIQAQFEIAPRIRIVPSVVSLGSVAYGETVHGTVAFVGRDSHAIRVIRVDVPDDCSISFSGEKGSSQMTVHATPHERGIWERTIRVNAECDDAITEMEIKCFAYTQ